ncbi:MAG: hypothetical protein M0Z90_00780 [Desulfobacteraceae bacterium]|nr:hypothetical protein [Desulfobacteraceae bacterium]
MNALILDYFGDWRTRRLTCPACGWTGTFQEGNWELFEALEDCHCPGDHGGSQAPMLAILPFPTLAEWEAHEAQLSSAERAYVGRVRDGRERFMARKLKGADELPDLPGEALDLAWDQAGDEVVIRLGDREVWREPVRYESLWRYEQVLALLRTKYGARLRDLAPTPASEYHLYGDQTAAPHAVARLRKRLREAWNAGAPVKREKRVKREHR